MKNVLVVTTAVLCAACAPDVWEPDHLARGAGTPQDDVLRRGRESYETYCVGCHGANGDGEGPAARFLDPKPRDLRLGRVKFASVPAGSAPRDEDLMRTITRGLTGTSMPAWDLVPLDEATAIIAYVRTFSDAWQQPPAQPVPIPDDPFRKRPERGVEEGESVYHGLAACSSCHPAYVPHERVKAHMKAADIPFTGFRTHMYRSVPKESQWGAPITPPDFLVERTKSGATREDLVRVIAAGVGGTAMPSWGASLTPKQLWGLAYYVESLTKKRGSREAAALRRELDAQPPAEEGAAK